MNAAQSSSASPFFAVMSGRSGDQSPSCRKLRTVELRPQHSSFQIFALELMTEPQRDTDVVGPDRPNPVVRNSGQGPARHQVSHSRIELERQFCGFAVLWALASLHAAWSRFTLAAGEPWQTSLALTAAMLSAVLIFRPRSTLSLTMLGIVHACHGLYAMPFLPTADLLHLFFGVAVFCSYIRGAIAWRSFGVRPIGMFRDFAPCLRVLFLTNLAATSLARFNWAFLNVEVSPATRTFGAILDRLPTAGGCSMHSFRYCLHSIW